MTEKNKRFEISKTRAVQVQKIDPVNAYVAGSPSLSTSMTAPSSDKITKNFALSKLSRTSFIGENSLHDQSKVSNDRSRHT